MLRSPLRDKVTTLVAPSSSFAEKLAKLNCTEVPLSASLIVTSCVVWPLAVSSVPLLTVRVTVSFPSTSVSLAGSKETV